MAATGTSFANHLAMAVLIESGDEVVVETPTYEPMLATAALPRRSDDRFPRRAEAGFPIDLDALADAVTTRTRLIVLANLHNPSGAFTDTARCWRSPPSPSASVPGY